MVESYSVLILNFVDISLLLIKKYYFQHPFINCDLDSKSIKELLLEYKAEVVEEEVLDEDTDVSTISYLLIVHKLASLLKLSNYFVKFSFFLIDWN
jgi:hypothetical protein